MNCIVHCSQGKNNALWVKQLKFFVVIFGTASFIDASSSTDDVESCLFSTAYLFCYNYFEN